MENDKEAVREEREVKPLMNVVQRERDTRGRIRDTKKGEKEEEVNS